MVRRRCSEEEEEYSLYDSSTGKFLCHTGSYGGGILASMDWFSGCLIFPSGRHLQLHRWTGLSKISSKSTNKNPLWRRLA